MIQDSFSRVPRLMSEHEAARVLHCSIDTLRRVRKRGEIGYTMVSGRVFYTEKQIAEYLERQRVDPCHDQNKTEQDKSGTTGSRSAQTVPSGAGHGSTRTPDRHDAHRLAQRTFGTPSSDLPNG